MERIYLEVAERLPKGILIMVLQSPDWPNVLQFVSLDHYKLLSLPSLIMQLGFKVSWPLLFRALKASAPTI